MEKKLKYRFFAVITLLATSTWIDFISILTYVGYELQLSPLYVALVTVAMLLPQAAFGKQLAKIVQTYRAQHLFVVSTIIRIICTISLVWIDSFALLLLVLLIRAFCLGLMQPIIASQAKELAQSEGGRFASILNLINTVSKVVAPSIGGVISVLYNEKAVFILSALLALLALCILILKPLKESANNTSSSTSTKTISISNKAFLFSFACVVLFISGISAMYTGLIPYAFNFYSVPKLTLSIALSASAMAGIIFNLIVIKKNPTVKEFPFFHFYIAWMLSAVFFAFLSLAMPAGNLSLVLIPLAFAGITVARAYFEVFSNSYIYTLEKQDAIYLSTFKQSLVSVAGIVATFFGAFSFSAFEPMHVLLAVAVLSMALCNVWILITSINRKTVKYVSKTQ